MSTIRIKQKGNFSKLTKYLGRVEKSIDLKLLDKYGKRGVTALSSATPVDSGLTSESWEYEVKYKNGVASITFYNTNVQNGVLIAIILQYGHGTRNGGWVEGRDYINPAIQPIFDELAKSAWEEATKA